MSFESERTTVVGATFDRGQQGLIRIDEEWELTWKLRVVGIISISFDHRSAFKRATCNITLGLNFEYNFIDPSYWYISTLLAFWVDWIGDVFDCWSDWKRFQVFQTFFAFLISIQFYWEKWYFDGKKIARDLILWLCIKIGKFQRKLSEKWMYNELLYLTGNWC